MRTLVRFLSLGTITASAAFVMTAFSPSPAQVAKVAAGPDTGYCDVVCGDVGFKPRNTSCRLRNTPSPYDQVNCGFYYDSIPY